MKPVFSEDKAVQGKNINPTTKKSTGKYAK